MESIPRPALALAPPSLLGSAPTAIQQSSTYAAVAKRVLAAAPMPSTFKARTGFLKSQQCWIKNRCIRCDELGHQAISGRNARVCFICRQTGHISSNYAHNPKRGLAHNRFARVSHPILFPHRSTLLLRWRCRICL
jgi:hypothetical protein